MRPRKSVLHHESSIRDPLDRFSMYCTIRASLLAVAISRNPMDMLAELCKGEVKDLTWRRPSCSFAPSLPTSMR